MRETLREARERVRERLRGPEVEEEELGGELKPLRMMAAQMLMLTGIGGTLELLSRSAAQRNAHGAERAAGSLLERTRPGAWAPLLIGPMAALAQVAHGLRPSPSTAAATRVLGAASIGAGLAGFADALASSRTSPGAPPLGPIALASAGVLSLALDREEQRLEQDRARLQRRASVVQRLVPRRRARLDRIVVHV